MLDFGRLTDEYVLSKEKYFTERECFLTPEERTAWRMRLWDAKLRKVNSNEQGNS